MPFFTGYGVEIGMVIDVYEQIGLDGMAQVDLGTRQNRHQPLASLTRMSSVVLRTVAAREGLAAGPRRRRPDGTEPGLWELRQPDTYLHAVATDDGLRLDEHLNELVERPPLARLTGGSAAQRHRLGPRAPGGRGPPDAPSQGPADKVRAGICAARINDISRRIRMM